MPKTKGGLGKGLDALFADNSVEELSQNSAVKLKLTQIEPNREQPRKHFDEEALADLAESIQLHGVIQPLLVRPMSDGSYQLVAGERRWRASRLAGLTEVPVVIRELSDTETMELALIENLQREDLNPIEEAEGLQVLIETYGMTQEEAAKSVGCSRPSITNALRLLKLPREVREMTREGKISAGHARALLAFQDEQKLIETAKLIEEKEITVREIEKMAKSKEKIDNSRQSHQLKRRDSYYDEVELALSNTLGRKVRVITGKEKGTLEIEFYSKEDLAAIANKIGEE